jgi:hypothetical protein
MVQHPRLEQIEIGSAIHLAFRRAAPVKRPWLNIFFVEPILTADLPYHRFNKLTVREWTECSEKLRAFE